MPNIIDHIIVEIDWTNSGINDLDTTLTVADINDSGQTLYPPGCPDSDINSVCADYTGPVGACTDNLADYVEYAGDHTGIGKESFVVRVDNILSSFPSALILDLLPKAQWGHILSQEERGSINNVGFIRINYKLYSGGVASVVSGQYISSGTLVKSLYTLVDPDVLLGSSKLSCCLVGGNKIQSCNDFVCLDVFRINWDTGSLDAYQNPPAENRIYVDLTVLEGYCDRSCECPATTTSGPTTTTTTTTTTTSPPCADSSMLYLGAAIGPHAPYGVTVLPNLALYKYDIASKKSTRISHDVWGDPILGDYFPTNPNCIDIAHTKNKFWIGPVNGVHPPDFEHGIGGYCDGSIITEWDIESFEPFTMSYKRQLILSDSVPNFGMSCDGDETIITTKAEDPLYPEGGGRIIVGVDTNNTSSVTVRAELPTNCSLSSAADICLTSNGKLIVSCGCMITSPSWNILVYDYESGLLEKNYDITTSLIGCNSFRAGYGGVTGLGGAGEDIYLFTICGDVYKMNSDGTLTLYDEIGRDLWDEYNDTLVYGGYKSGQNTKLQIFAASQIKDCITQSLPSSCSCNSVTDDCNIISVFIDIPRSIIAPVTTTVNPNDCNIYLYAWGNNLFGQIGDGTQFETPGFSGGQVRHKLVGNGFAKLSSGENHSHFLAIKSNGDLYSWGKNLYGEIGNNTRTDSFNPVKIGEDYIEVSGGSYASFGIKSNSDLYAWGDVVGDNKLDYNTPTKIGEGYKKVSAGEQFVFAIKSNGDLYSWWYNSINSPKFGPNNYIPTKIDEDIVAVNSGDGGGIALKSNGDLYLIAYDEFYNFSIKTKLGEGYKVMAPGHGWNGYAQQQYTPSLAAIKNNGELHVWYVTDDVVGDFQIIEGDWLEVSTGEDFVLALRTNGDVYAWGGNFKAAGTSRQSSTPIKIGEGYSSIATSDWTSYGLKYSCPTTTTTTTTIAPAIISGTLWAWGYNGKGQLGDGTVLAKSSPIQIGSDNDWKSIIANSGTNPASHTMALKTNGTLWAWGYNEFGQLGDGTVVDKLSPIQIGSDSDWESISVGSNFTIAIKTDRTLWAWGNNLKGQLGDGTGINKNSPIQIGSDNDWESISAGGESAFALKINGTLWAWGLSRFCQLGNGMSSPNQLSPIQIGSGSDWKLISTGENSTIALKNDGTLWAWGYNEFGQLGVGPPRSTLDTPTLIGSDNDWKSISVGGNFAIALKTNRTLWAWGYNGQHQLGDGTWVDKTSPVQIGSDNDWESISAGTAHTVALKTNGTLWAWGANGSGQLGKGDPSAPYWGSIAQVGSDTWHTAIAGIGDSLGIKSNNTNTTTTIAPTTTTTVAPITTTVAPTTTTVAPDPFVCVSGSVNCRAVITDDICANDPPQCGTSANTFIGGFGSNICQAKPVGASTFGNIFLNCQIQNSNDYQVGISMCLWDGSINLVNLSIYGFNVNSYIFISDAEKDVPSGSTSSYTPYNGRYLIVSHGPFYSVLRKVGNNDQP